MDRAYAAANGLDQYGLVSSGQASRTLANDPRGDLLTDGSFSFAYDAEDRLVKVTGARSLDLAYDPLGRLRTTSGGNAAATTFLYDGDDLVAEYDPGSGALLRRYAHGPGVDEPLVWYEGADLGDRRYLHADERGERVAVARN